MRPPGGGGRPPYRNPLRGATITPERIDQGVDYAGSGPLYALGSGTIEEVLNAGWPGGTFIDERLDAGPDAGMHVFVAEEITPAPGLHIGQHVTSRTVLGELHGGMETGWAAPPPNTGQTLAWVSGQSNYHGDPGAHPTAWGADYSKLLASLGAPPGVLSGRPVGSTTPPGSAPGPSGISGLAGLAIIVPLVLAGAGLALWGAARATGADKVIRKAGATAGTAALAAA